MLFRFRTNLLFYIYNKMKGEKPEPSSGLPAMILKKETAVALRCLDCGPFYLEKINVFQLSDKRGCQIICPCGQKKAVISRLGKLNLEICYYCPVCEKQHTQILKTSRFWASDSENPLICKSTGLNLGYFGDYHKLKEKEIKEKKEMELLTRELGSDDFSNPEVILEALDYIHDLAAEGSLHCECQALHIDINLSRENIRLECASCGNFVIIPTARRQDLKNLRKLTELKLVNNIFFLREILREADGTGVNH